jgi:DNA-binding response OmpR family regulator
MTVLVVDDHEAFRRQMTELLERAGFGVRAAAGVGEASVLLGEAGTGGFDLVLLDVNMPDAQGWDLLEMIREGGDETPVIFLSASDEPVDRVRGLRLGADDYVGKPCDPLELVARIESVVRRRRTLPLLRFGEVILDVAAMTVRGKGQRVELSGREFAVLRMLVEARGRPVSRQELLKQVWGIEFEPETTLVEVVVSRLRRKLRRVAPQLIETRPGSGYLARTSADLERS